MTSLLRQWKIRSFSFTLLHPLLYPKDHTQQRPKVAMLIHYPQNSQEWTILKFCEWPLHALPWLRKMELNRKITKRNFYPSSLNQWKKCGYCANSKYKWPTLLWSQFKNWIQVRIYKWESPGGKCLMINIYSS